MASKLIKEINLSKKGRTGPLTINQRKKRNMKAKPNIAKTTKGKFTKR